MDIGSTGKLIISVVYYILVAALSLFSAFGVYILLRYGRTVPVAVLISVMYIIFFMTALLSSYSSLKAIQAL